VAEFWNPTGLRGHIPRGRGPDGRLRDRGVHRGGGPADGQRGADPRAWP